MTLAIHFSLQEPMKCERFKHSVYLSLDKINTHLSVMKILPKPFVVPYGQ